MEQEITHYFRGKLHVGQITVRESARSTKERFEIGALCRWKGMGSWEKTFYLNPSTGYTPILYTWKWWTAYCVQHLKSSLSSLYTSCIIR